jgi:hypothetical protein
MRISRVVYELGMLVLYTDDPDKKFLNEFKEGEYEIKRKEEKRTTRANSFMWALCRDIAEKTGISKDEVYTNAIKELNIYKDFTLTEDQAKTFKVAWEKLGTGWITEQVDYDGDEVVIRAYYGSSTYNKKQMARLIDNLLQDARSVGIEPPDSEYIKSLINNM